MSIRFEFKIRSARVRVLFHRSEFAYCGPRLHVSRLRRGECPSHPRPCMDINFRIIFDVVLHIAVRNAKQITSFRRKEAAQ